MQTAIALAIAKAVNSPIQQTSAEEYLRQEAQAKQRRNNRRIENRIAQAWKVCAYGKVLSNRNVESMLADRILCLYEALDDEALDYVISAGVSQADPLKAQRILAGFR
jgi:hypothetical protein